MPHTKTTDANPSAHSAGKAGGGSSKAGMIALLSFVLLACAAWLSYQIFFTGPSVPRAGTLPTTPEFQEMTELTAKLKSDERFKTLEVSRNAEGKWVCGGAIPRASDQAALEAKLKELKPDAEWVIDVSPMHR